MVRVDEQIERPLRVRLRKAAIATVLVVLGVVVPVLVSQLLPRKHVPGAYVTNEPVIDQGFVVPAGAVASLLASMGLMTVALAVVVGMLWFFLDRWVWGRAVTIVIGVLGVGAMLSLSCANGFIPPNYCPAFLPG